jgi:hypothetical protein
LLSTRSYKNIHIEWFARFKPFKILEKFAPSLENLGIDGTHEYAASPFPFTFVEFPRLKCLQLDEVSPIVEKWIIQCLWASNVQLEEFAIDVNHKINSVFNNTVRFILQQKELKQLTIENVDEEGEESVASANVRSLIKIIGKESVGLGKVEKLTYKDESDDNLMELLPFMPLLRELNVEEIVQADLAFILDQTRFPYLTTFTTCYIYFNEDLLLKANDKVTRASFCVCRGLLDDNELKSLLMSLRSLKELELSGTSDDDNYDEFKVWTKDFMEFVAVNMEKLELIKTYEDREEAEQHYEQMKRERDDINKNIQFAPSLANTF